jgi:hypothetical protein
MVAGRRIVIGLIFVVAVMNVAIGFALAVLLGQGPAGLRLALPKISLPGKGAKEPAGH